MDRSSTQRVASWRCYVIEKEFMIGSTPIDIGAHLWFPATGLGYNAILAGLQVDHTDPPLFSGLGLPVLEGQLEYR